MIPVLRPTINARTKKELLEILDSGWWTQGKKVEELEKKFADYVGIKYAVAVNSGTSALDMCLKAYDIKGGELITTPMTFVSDAIVGEWNGMDVTFADIDENTLCLDPDKVFPTSKTKAVIAVHSHGRLANVSGIRKKFDGLIIEDCAHAMHTPMAGQMGDIAIWSFQAVKTMPAGDGGMVTTNSQKIAKKLKNISWLGVEKTTYKRDTKKGYQWEYDITHTGIKSYMNDITATICLGQLRRLKKLLKKRRAIQERYNQAFKNLSKVELPHYSHTVQYYTLKVEERDKIAEFLAKKGISTSVHFKPLSEMTYWKKAVKRKLPRTNAIWKKLLTLPCHDALTNKELEYIIKCFREAYESILGKK